jgi:head-tail adaptor
MIRLLRIGLPGDVVRERIERNLAAQEQPELSAIHLVRGTRDITAAMPRFVADFLKAQFAA